MKRVLPPLLIAAGSLMLIFAVGYLLFNRALDQPGPAPVPDQIAGLPLSGKTTGRQALSEISRMHGKEFPLTSGAVGDYGDSRQVTLWVSGALVRPMAATILNAMRDKIAEGNSPFIPISERQEGKRTIYELDGMGQKHFYFQSNNLIIWLAADVALSERALRETLKFYP